MDGIFSFLVVKLQRLKHNSGTRLVAAGKHSLMVGIREVGGGGQSELKIRWSLSEICSARVEEVREGH